PGDLLLTINLGLPTAISVVLSLLAFLGLLLHERASNWLMSPVLSTVIAVGLSLLLHRSAPSPDHWSALAPFWLMACAAGLVVSLRHAEQTHQIALGFLGCVLIATPNVYPNDAGGSVLPGVLTAAHALVPELAEGDRIVAIGPASELLRYYLAVEGLAFDPVVNPTETAYFLTLSDNRVYAVSDNLADFQQATDYISFGATNLSIDMVPLATYERTTIEEVVVNATTPVTTTTRIALFNDDFETDSLAPHWDYDPVTTRIRNVGLNRVVEIESEDEWVFLDLIDEGTLWIDYSVFARVRVLHSGSTDDDVFAHVRYLPPIGSYLGSVNVSEDVGMLSADFNRTWRGPLGPVSVTTLEDNSWHTIRVRAVGNAVALYVNGSQQYQTRDNTIERGSIRFVVPPNHHVQIDDVVVIEEVDWALTPTAEYSGVSNATIPAIDNWQFLTLDKPEDNSDFAIEARVRFNETVDEEYDLLFLLRETWQGNYVAALDVDNDIVSIGEDREGVWQGELAERQTPLEPGRWYTLRTQLVEDSLSLLVDGQQVVRTLDDRYTTGDVRLAIPPGVGLQIEDITLYLREDAP
ncbi:MAG: hypothetical protein AAF125_03425, partial [Chloroflexota bacterium]